ncbi:MAG: 1-acyl-sn-glycerol-3-phosphate acyltransferase [Myxococcales bacterium]|nr:1-acyl-sn-glycerol-3-phosphate acyltransferase [Myxococcales bacterium]
MFERGNRNTTQARVARAGLRALGGWRFIGEIPEPRKAVCLAVPHTDNLDGLLLVLLAQSAGMHISWLIKDAWGKGLMGKVVRGVGGVPVDRTRAHGMVGQMIDELAARDDFYLVIPPEGTRSRAEYWKSGFYHIALGAKVPVVPGFLCYGKKQGGFGPPIELTGNVRADMDRLRAFYAESNPVPRYPAKYGPIRLREEEESAGT